MGSTNRFLGKEIAVLICPGSQGGDFSVQVDGAPGTTVSGYKDPTVSRDQCIIARPYTNSNLTDSSHDIEVVIAGSPAGSAANGTTVEFGGFM